MAMNDCDSIVLVENAKADAEVLRNRARELLDLFNDGDTVLTRQYEVMGFLLWLSELDRPLLIPREMAAHEFVAQQRKLTEAVRLLTLAREDCEEFANTLESKGLADPVGLRAGIAEIDAFLQDGPQETP